jgi:peptidoglycan-associated lipoprotein
MTTTFREFLGVVSIAALCGLSAGCAKKAASIPPPPPAPATATSAPETRAPERQARPAAAPSRTAEAPPAPRYPDTKTLAKIDELLARIQDAYFDYDRHNLRPDALKTLEADGKELGEIIRQYPDFKLKVEGYCDERGSAEYNLALGDRRAAAAKEYLVSLGLPGNQMTLASLGKEKQLCEEHSEECWQKNRRAHIVAMAQP